MAKIDAHVHWNIERQDYVDLLDELNVRLMNVSVARDGIGKWRETNADLWSGQAAKYPSKAAWITGFDLPLFDSDGYQERVIEELKTDLAAGAIACKVWKNIGMEVKKPDGSWLMVDDPIFDPILQFLATEEIPLLAHIAEPLACWQPADLPNPHSAYYAAHPEWHFHGRTGHPTHEEIIDARDRMLANNPTLRVIGAHLASLEYDLAEISRRLDQYPNLAVDTSARLLDLAAKRPGDLLEFFEAYSDRILWGTDTVNRDATDTPESLRRRYLQEFRFYETTDIISTAFGDAKGAGLRPVVLDRLYCKNALEWYPRLADRWPV
jgi:hypothetical protein